MIDINNIAINIKDIYKVYQTKNQDGVFKDFYALNNVSFSIGKGEIIGIIGKNGSGKSTLLKILSGITKPSKGFIEINGTVASILDIGTGFHPDLSGRENIYLRGELLGMSKPEINAVFDEIVAFSEIIDFIDTAVKHYSSGMFLRLAFSIIIHLKTDILILDEVMSVGDASFRKKSIDKIIELTKNKTKTIVIVSHNILELSKITRNFKFFEKGYLVDKSSSDILHNYFYDSIPRKTTIFNDVIIKTLDSNLLNKSIFNNNEDVLINLYNVCLNTKDYPYFALTIKDSFQNVVFISSPYFSKNKNLPTILGENMNLQAIIPKYTFNKGTFYIDIVFSTKEEIVYTIVNATSFKIELEEKFDGHALYGESGSLKPYLDWKIK